MKQNIFIALALIIALAAFGVNFFKQPVGSVFSEPNAYSAAPTYSTNTLNSGAELLVSRAANRRSFVRICNVTGQDVVFLYKQNTATGVIIDQGSPIYATSGTNWPQVPACMTLDANDPYTGAIFGISSASTTVSIEQLQN